MSEPKDAAAARRIIELWHNPIRVSVERVRKAKTELADRLRHQFASEVAGGEMLWSDPKARSQHAKLRVEIRKLTNQIAGMGYPGQQHSR